MKNLAQLLQVPHVDNTLQYDISPDGQRLIFSWNKSGKWELWEIASGEIQILAMTMEGAKFSPRFSPDGSMLAFALDLDGSESYHIAIHDFNTNTTTDLTPSIAYAHQPNISWSPDGKMLAVLSDMKGQFAAYLLPVDGGPVRLLKNVFRPCWDAVWSPDGQWIAIESESTASDRTIHVVPVGRTRKGPKVNTVQLQVNGNVLNAQHPTWSPDSKFLAFCGENGEWHDIGLFNAETQEIIWVNESIGDDTQPVWSRSGETIGWIHSEGAKTSFQFKKTNADIAQIQIGAGVHSFPKFNAEGVVILYEDSSRPCDLWLMNLEDGTCTQMTDSLPAELKGVEFVQPEEVWYAGMDGMQVPALLYHGQGEQAVVDIHGGPNWHVQFLWAPTINYFVSRGFTVLMPNYRGSTGYGKKWQNASRYDMGGVDTDDCAAGAKYLRENGFKKIAVTGRSHGGFLTMSCLTRYPELFAGGSAVVPFLNWFKSHKDSREDLQHWNIENMGYPEDNQELWHSHSPYFFLDKINAPVQMICGGNDPRCPASDSFAARDRLIELGKDVELLLYKDEGHAFLNIDNVIDAEEKSVAFLEKVVNS